MFFFIWYYTRGLAQLVESGGNLFRYAFFRSHIVTLAKTLVSPWRRDVSLHTWRGFHPVLALRALLNNFISRFLGMLVRLGVIVYGVVWMLFVSIVIVILTVAYAVAPVGLLLSFPLFSVSAMQGSVAFLVFFLILFFTFLGWRNDRKATAFRKNYLKAPWMERTFARLSLDMQSFEKIGSFTRDELVSQLAPLHIDAKTFERVEGWERDAYERKMEKATLFTWSTLKKNAPIGKHWSYGYTPHLDRYLTDLSEPDFSDYGKLLRIGRNDAYELLTLTLSRPTENCAFLVGNPGIGKKTMVHTLARDIRENVFSNKILGDARVALFDLGQVMAEARSEHLDPKALVRRLFSEVAVAGNLILVIENIDLYLAPEAENNVSDVLNEFLGLPSFRVLGTLTPGSLHKLTEERIPALKYFEVIAVEEPTREETERILLDFFQTFEHERVVFTFSGIETILEASERYNWDAPFPERAIDLAQEAVLFWEKKGEQSYIDDKAVNAFLSLKSGVPLGEVTDEEREKLLNLETLLHERIVGQHEAVRQMAEAFRKAREGLGNDKRPVGSFLFLGPTGVGKTETAKALAAVYFGDEEKMVRLDMSEFQNQESVGDLIGSAENKMPGRMTELVKEHPFSILLLDEIEKAHPRVLDIFLQILDEGFVTDDFGNKVNFRNLIIIATSNAGANMIRTATEAGRSMQEIKKELIETVIQKNLFRPEFLNRFDGVILFNALTQEEIQKVTERKLAVFAKKVEDEKKIKLHFGPDVVAELVARGYEPEFGVRSINRYISDVVEDRVVQKILTGSLAPGAEITVTANDIL